MMRSFPAVICFSIFVIASCDLRSETAKRSMERFTTGPTPQFSPEPAVSPADPRDVVAVDTSAEGDPIYVDGPNVKRSVNCSKFNSVKINGNRNTVAIAGACNQVMINGDGNRITADAATEYVFNGTENVLKYSRFVNGKRPVMIENRGGNQIEKAAAEKR